MHVLILNQTFYPDVAATGQLMWDLARHLERRGHRITAVTSRNFYGTTRQHDLAHEWIGDIEIHRLGGTALGKRNLLSRLLDFASFYLAAARHLQNHPLPDVVLSLTSPPMISTLAMLQKQFRRRPDGSRVRLVYHMMDLYPEAAVASGLMRPGNPIDRALHRLTARALKLSDAVITLGEDMRRRLERDYSEAVIPRLIHVVQPWADGNALFPMADAANPMRENLGLNGSFNIVYSGNLGVAHDLDTMLAAMKLMRDDADARWVFIGGGKRFDLLQEQVRGAGLANARFFPFQERDSLNESLNLADVHLVSQLPSFTGVVVPSKLFGILAVGKPTVMIGPADAECSRVVAAADAGFIVANGDADTLVRRLRQLRNDPAQREAIGTRARRAFEQNYEQRVACARIASILEQAAAR